MTRVACLPPSEQPPPDLPPSPATLLEDPSDDEDEQFHDYGGTAQWQIRVERKLGLRPIRIEGVSVSTNSLYWTELTGMDMLHLQIRPIRDRCSERRLTRLDTCTGLECRSYYSDFTLWLTFLGRQRRGDIQFYMLARPPSDTACYVRLPISHFRLADFRRWTQRSTDKVARLSEMMPSYWRRTDFRRWIQRARKEWARKQPSQPQVPLASWPEIMQQLSGVWLFNLLDAEVLYYIYSLITPLQLRWNRDESLDTRVLMNVCIRPNCGLLYGCHPRDCCIIVRRQVGTRAAMGHGPIHNLRYSLGARTYIGGRIRNSEREDEWAWRSLWIRRFLLSTGDPQPPVEVTW